MKIHDHNFFFTSGDSNALNLDATDRRYMVVDRKISIEEYFLMLQNFDWYYGMSDDHKVWQKGETERQKIQSITRTSETHRRLYLDWNKHKYHCSLKPILEDYI